jgi:hypothetical protein
LTGTVEADTPTLTWEPAKEAEAKAAVAAALLEAASIGDDWASTDFTGPTTPTVGHDHSLHVDGLTAGEDFLRTATKHYLQNSLNTIYPHRTA